MKKNFLLAACLLSILFSCGVSAANIIWSGTEISTQSTSWVNR